MEVVLVTGVQPGPALWKVSSGDHVLWILGEVSPLPAKVKWESKRFESLLAKTQEVLLELGEFAPPSSAQNSALFKMRNLPDGLTLKDILSPALYVRVEATSRIYDMQGEIERLRPGYASRQLWLNAFDAMNLRAFAAGVAVRKLAQKANVRVMVVDTPRQSVDESIRIAERAGVGSSAPCLERVVEILEDGGSGLRRLANAWSLGDIPALRQLVPSYVALNGAHRPSKCKIAAYGGLQRANEFTARRTESWLNEAGRALRENRQTIAVVPMGELFAPDGYLAGLRAKGYEVEEPD
jgi:uncharacterized protein YbaP (TraB family)